MKLNKRFLAQSADLHPFVTVKNHRTHFGELRVLAWLRRIIVSFGVGGMSYALMLAFMVASVVYDRELEPVVTLAFETGRQITDLLESWVSGNYWGQVAVNHLRERVNMTHVVLSIPAIVLAVILVGIPLNRFLGGTRSALQLRGLDLAGISECAERLGGFDSGSPKIDQRRPTRLFRSPLRHHGIVQFGRCLFGQRPFCLRKNQICRFGTAVPW